MKSQNALARLLTITSLVVGLGTLVVGTAQAHCDTTGGPVIPEAQAALQNGDVTPVLKWVKKEHETEIKDAFAKALAVRTKGPEAQELADRYFLETLVRIHRAGEGAPYAGIKDEPVAPIVALSDKALAEGSADEMVKKIAGHIAAAIKEKHAKAVEAQAHKDESVEAGRAFVEAYVTYMHFVEGIHAAVMGPAAHRPEGAAVADAHKH